MGGRIITDKGTHVLWQVSGQAGVNLHKIGEGTLTVNGTGVNAGGLKVGTVLLFSTSRRMLTEGTGFQL